MKKLYGLILSIFCLCLVGCWKSEKEVFEAKQYCSTASDTSIMGDLRTRNEKESWSFYSENKNTCIWYWEYQYYNDDENFRVTYLVIKDLLSWEEILSCEKTAECWNKYTNKLKSLRK